MDKINIKMLKDSMLKLFLINLVRDYLAYKNKKKCDKIYIKAKCVRACSLYRVI